MAHSVYSIAHTLKKGVNRDWKLPKSEFAHL